MSLPLAAALLGLSSADMRAAPAYPSPPCREGDPQPTISDQLRPMQTAACRDGAAELNGRVLSLLRLNARNLSVESVERALGLPRLRTSFDSDWGASYTTIFSAAPDSGFWQLMLSYDEHSWPQSGPPTYRGSMRPVRINRRGQPEIWLRINWFQPRDIRPGSPECLGTDRLVHEARRRGWHVGEVIVDVSDVGAHREISLTQGRARINLMPSYDQPCVNRFELDVDD